MNSSVDDCLTVRFTHYYNLDEGKLNTKNKHHCQTRTLNLDQRAQLTRDERFHFRLLGSYAFTQIFTEKKAIYFGHDSFILFIGLLLNRKLKVLTAEECWISLLSFLVLIRHYVKHFRTGGYADMTRKSTTCYLCCLLMTFRRQILPHYDFYAH